MFFLAYVGVIGEGISIMCSDLISQKSQYELIHFILYLHTLTVGQWFSRLGLLNFRRNT